MTSGPMEIEVIRGPFPESFHSVDVVVAEVEEPIQVWGDADRLVLPRSAAKFLQAIPLVRTGAAAAFAVTDDELALACASHSAEEPHLDVVESWLGRLGFGPDDLECGADLPLDEATRQAWLSSGRTRERLANCCSGKHAGFLTIARHLGWDHSGYIEADHPVQRLVSESIEQFCGPLKLGTGQVKPGTAGIDGCGIPAWRVPLAQMARAMARVTRPQDFDALTVAAADRIVKSVASRHFLVAGTNRAETRLAAAIAEPVLLKSGAEGVFVAALPERGLGVALKARDGADRAARVALATVLVELGVLETAAASELLAVPIMNKAGERVGEVRRSP